MGTQTARPLTTSRGGATAFRGVPYAAESGRRVTAAGAASRKGWRAGRSGEAA
jgi:hypothetical protein